MSTEDQKKSPVINESLHEAKTELVPAPQADVGAPAAPAVEPVPRVCVRTPSRRVVCGEVVADAAEAPKKLPDGGGAA